MNCRKSRYQIFLLAFLIKLISSVMLRCFEIKSFNFLVILIISYPYFFSIILKISMWAYNLMVNNIIKSKYIFVENKKIYFLTIYLDLISKVHFQSVIFIYKNYRNENIKSNLKNQKQILSKGIPEHMPNKLNTNILFCFFLNGKFIWDSFSLFSVHIYMSQKSHVIDR